MAEAAGQAPPAMPDSPTATLGQMNANLSVAKEARKRTELDAQLLANRIALLKEEERKAWRKITETRKKAEEIRDRRKVNEDRFFEKEEYYSNKWKSIRDAQTMNKQVRDVSRAALVERSAAMLDQKHGNAQAVKHQSQQHLLQKKEREAHERQDRSTRSASIKNRKLEAKKKMEEDRQIMVEKGRCDYEARISQEDMLRARTDALVARMEREEMELIQRLQNTQLVQKNAYEELEGALGAASTQISTSARGPAGPGPAALAPAQAAA